MLFVEPRFVAFFVVVFGVHWALRAHRLRKLWLLAASYVFYASWDWRFLSLILVSTGIDFVVGRRLGVVEGPRARRAWLALSVTANLGILGAFKYFDFFVESAAGFIAWLGLHPSDVTLNVVLPVGISFYTFQTMSYTIDVYRRKLAPTNSLLDFALFVAFFPQLVAGPIVRAIEFLPQLAHVRRFAEHVRVRECLALFLIGYFKKACLADNLAIPVDAVFAEPGAYSAGSAWLTWCLYTVQVYGDFSGYTDMAIAAAGLLGYRLTLNFDFPFFARSVTAFWRRWHVSLSLWFRDYLYVSLGGSQVRRGRLIGNVYATMALCGLWHGADWKYVVFGLVHATYLLVNQAWKRLRPTWLLPGGIPALPAVAITFAFLLVTWPIFRGNDAGSTLEMIRIALFLEPGGEAALAPRWGALFAACVAVHFLFYRRVLTPRMAAAPVWLFALGYGAAWAVVLPCAASGYQPFIYFQF